jgi:CDP-diacylglycerol--glycerol-3-phosphate 3-phosphatidyltransferase
MALKKKDKKIDLSIKNRGRKMNLPNKITLSRILLVPIFMVFIIPFPDWVLNSTWLEFINPQLQTLNNYIINYGNYLGAIIFIVAAVTDKVDGYIARRRNLVTKLGIFLDPIADKLIITAALIALVQRNDVTGWVAMLIIAREFIVTGFRLIAVGEGIVLPADKWGKIKMVIQTVAVSLALLKNYPLSLFTAFQFDRYAILIAIIVTIYSGFNYIYKNRSVINSF